MVLYFSLVLLIYSFVIYWVTVKKVKIARKTPTFQGHRNAIVKVKLVLLVKYCLVHVTTNLFLM